MKILLILHYMCGSLATAGMVWAERVYIYTKKIMTPTTIIQVSTSIFVHYQHLSPN
ncbi:MAG: hypothetical protein OEY49_06620 [Candidatus Heimdallarchaeota archaeon]|nr:hypothetical protein [Candidatus Heimdallarchaeota archaeon]